MRNMFGPATEIELYDDDGIRVTNRNTLEAMREADILIAYHKAGIPDIQDKKLYDDDGNEVTNPATLRALAEAQQIIRDDMVRWRLAHGVED